MIFWSYAIWAFSTSNSFCIISWLARSKDSCASMTVSFAEETSRLAISFSTVRSMTNCSPWSKADWASVTASALAGCAQNKDAKDKVIAIAR